MKNVKKSLKIIGITVLSIFWLLVIIAMIDTGINSTDDDNDETNRTEETNETEEVTEPIVLTPEEEVQKTIEDALGEYSNREDDNGNKMKRVREIKITDKYLFIDLVGTNSTDRVFANHFEIIKIMQEIEIPEVEEINFRFYYSMRNENYDVIEEVGMSCWVTESKYGINWDNVLPDDIPNIVTNYYKISWL